LHKLDVLGCIKTKSFCSITDISKEKAKQHAEITKCKWNLYSAKCKQNSAAKLPNEGFSLFKWKSKMRLTDGLFSVIFQPGIYSYLYIIESLTQYFARQLFW
jgi:hypothetical protein